MQDFLISMALSVLFTLLKTFIKNPAAKEQVKKALVKLGKAIIEAYPEEFPNL